MKVSQINDIPAKKIKENKYILAFSTTSLTAA